MYPDSVSFNALCTSAWQLCPCSCPSDTICNGVMWRCLWRMLISEVGHFSCKNNHITHVNVIEFRHRCAWLWFNFSSRTHYNDVIMSVPNYQLFTQPFIQVQIKETSKLCVTGLCWGNSAVTGEVPVQRASNAENASIWWRHHARDWIPHFKNEKDFEEHFIRTQHIWRQI